MLSFKIPTMGQSSSFFRFEADFVASLRCIPMQVRLKLDTCGIKLKLPQWSAFDPADRQQLVELSCDTPELAQAYRDFLRQLIWERTGETASELTVDPHPAWRDRTKIADSVSNKAQEVGVELSLQQWSMLSYEQRFALFKLSRSSHENRNFLPALKEFNVM